jgi:hypothetical protein
MSEPPVIPIQNLYYLLCYAWDRLDQSHVVDVSASDCPTPVDLFASLLIKGTEHLRRRGLNMGYQFQDAEIASIRGKVDILNTERRLLLQHARAACNFDELTVDTLPNRILKSTLRLLASDPDVDRLHRSGIHRVLKTLVAVADVRVNPRSFRMIQLDRNSSFYRFLLNICELVHSARVPEEEAGRYRFRDFLRDEKKMAFLFQYFVYNFLRLERRDLDVRREIIPWKIDSSSHGTRSACAMAVSLTACSSITEWGYKMPTGSERFSAVPAEKVKILFAPPGRPYRQIGIVSALGGGVFVGRCDVQKAEESGSGPGRRRGPSHRTITRSYDGAGRPNNTRQRLYRPTLRETVPTRP